MPLSLYLYGTQWVPFVLLVVWLWRSGGSACRPKGAGYGAVENLLAADNELGEMDGTLVAERQSMLIQRALTALSISMCVVVAASEILMWKQELQWDWGFEGVCHVVTSAVWCGVMGLHLRLQLQDRLPAIGISLFYAVDFLAMCSVGIHFSIDCASEGSLQSCDHSWRVARLAASGVLALIVWRMVLLLLCSLVLITVMVLLVLPMHGLTVLVRLCSGGLQPALGDPSDQCPVMYNAPEPLAECCSKPRKPPPAPTGEGPQVPVWLSVYQLWASWLPLYTVGLGAFHSALDLGGKEWCFECPDGMVTRRCNQQPEYCLGRRRVQRIWLGWRPKAQVDQMLSEIRRKYHGDDYGIVTNNCHHAVEQMWTSLDGAAGDIPAWVKRLHLLVLFFFPRSRVQEIEQAMLRSELDAKGLTPIRLALPAPTFPANVKHTVTPSKHASSPSPLTLSQEDRIARANSITPTSPNSPTSRRLTLHHPMLQDPGSQEEDISESNPLHGAIN